MKRALVAALACGLSSAASAAEPAPAVPSLWDAQRQLEKPDLGNLKPLRFLTGDDDPPFHFLLSDGTLVGFDVDLARAVCSELKQACTIQVRRRDTLLSALREGGGDVLLAPVSPAGRGSDLATTVPYYTTPGRFVAAAETSLPNAWPTTLAGHRIGVAADSPEAAYLERFFPKTERIVFASETEARDALRAGTLDAVFADAIVASLWLNGSGSDGCCRFLDGPFTDSQIFGDGVGMVVRSDDPALRRALDYGLAAAAAHGVYADLYLKYFPIGFY